MYGCSCLSLEMCFQARRVWRRRESPHASASARPSSMHDVGLWLSNDGPRSLRQVGCLAARGMNSPKTAKCDFDTMLQQALVKFPESRIAG